MPYSNIYITTQDNLSFITGGYIQVIHDSSNYIVGQVVDYNTTPGLLVFTPITVVGSGTYNSWTIVCSSSPGEQGTSGTSGTSGVNGTSGSSGTSGIDGTSGISGTSGTSGVSGTSGTSGIDGTSGVSGTSGTSGVNGASGTSGVSGTSGTSGVNGTSGTSGTSGATGPSGASGTSGTSGTSGSTPNPNARTETTFTATAGQTTFTVAYTVGQVDVYYNGSKLAPAEFTATTGTSIVLATACQVNDIVDVVAYITGAGVGGGGTTNYFPKFTASTTLGDSALQQYSSGWLKLGSSSVSTGQFDVISNNAASYTLYEGYSTNTIQSYNSLSFTILNQIGATSTSLMDYDYSTKALTFQTNGNNERLRITSAGYVLIGTSTSTGAGASRLQVTGSTAQLLVSNTTPGHIALYSTGTDAYITKNTGSGNLLFGLAPQDGSSFTEQMRITSGGQVQVKQAGNTHSDGFSLYNNGGQIWNFVNGGDNNLYLGYNSTSKGYFSYSTGAYTALSDVNKKKDFEDSTIGLEAILGLKPTLYRMKDDEENIEKHLGFIAQEVREFIPQAYSENKNGDNIFIGLTEMPIIAALVKAIQEQQAQIEELKAKIK